MSITKNYYEEGMHFFQPKIHFQYPNEGKAVSEFPILNYTVAVLWKIFGEHEFIYRLLEYLILLCAMFFLYNTIIRFYESVWMALFSASVVLTSPLIAYYGLNFIVDVPAFSIGLMSFCFGLKFYRTTKLSYFYWALGLGTLAVLMKASALMGLSILVLCSLIDILNLNALFGIHKLFSKKVLPLIFIFISAVLIAGWYSYALYYNGYDNNHVFLLTILPIWDMSGEDFISSLKQLFNTWFPLFLNRPMFFLFISLVIFVAANFRRLDAFLKVAFLGSALFFVTYLLVFFWVFNVHDYYLINLMFFPAITLICLAHILSQSEYGFVNSSFTKIFVVFLVVFNSLHAAAIYRLRMVEKDPLVSWYPFISKEEIDLEGYLAWVYSNDIKRIENIKPVLREHGIKREDKIVSIPDGSFDISLYFMDQKGYTINRDHLINDTTVADRFFYRNIKYVVLSDTTLKKERAFRRIQYKLEPFFVYNNQVQVFKVKQGL
ncbi:MAG: glycosyltransferase family 39 protein [Bacteroidia bacterium]|nr:glycosyltransferase family 39 protein [Bacteroidia bacterium]